jgi:asparagine synthase (glutamine-hydrolysing)
VHQYLTFLWVPDPLTMFEGISKIPPGHYAVYRDNSLDLTRYWDLTVPAAGATFQAKEGDLIAELRDRLLATVRSQMLSDVPVAAFLSAGIDSSSILAGMAEAAHQPVRTFTIGFPPEYRRGENTLDDPAVARRTAAHFGCRHTEIQVEPDVADLLPKLIWHMDEPTADPAIIMAYLINREAGKDATVLLSGVGGDELFAGYRKYRAHYLANHYRRIPRLLRRDVIEPAIQAFPSLSQTRLNGHVRLMKKMSRSASLPPIERFIMDSVYLTPEQQEHLLADAGRGQRMHSVPRSPHDDAFTSVAHADFLNQMLYVDMKTFMVSLNLNYNDKMSMANSTEVRVPFLDRELVEWVALHVSPQMKQRGRTSKYILREAMRPLLPADVLRQPKAGFGAPIDRWLRHDLVALVDDLLGEVSLRQRGLFDVDAVRRMIGQQRHGRIDWSLQIWQLLTLELWFRTFVDTDPHMTVEFR